MEEIEKKDKGILDKTVDFFFSNDNRKWLIPILIIAIILRVIVINHVAPVADEVVHGTHAINIINSGVINEQNQCPVWFYLTDISYRIFGVNAFAGRFLSFFFGILTIPLIFLISKKLFNEKIAVIAAFLLAISSYHINYALMEMDEAMIFFVLFSFYFFIKGIKEKQVSYLSIISIAVAVLIKPIALTFIPAFIIYFIFILYKQTPDNRKNILKKNTSRILIGGIIFLLFMTPVLAYNYILYEQKGIVDVLFARFLNINREIYSGLQGYDKGFSLQEIYTHGVPLILKGSFFKLDPAISVLAILGFILIFINKKYHPARFFILFHIITFIFLMGSAQMQTHFVVFMPLVTLASSAFICFASEKFSKKINSKKLIFILLIFIFAINLFILFPFIKSKSAVFQIRNYVASNIGEKDIVVADARIYRGRIAWMFNDKPYIESSYFPSLVELDRNISGNKIPITVYFIECAVDDCGWGTIGSQPDFNASVEQLVDFFKTKTAQEKIIYGGGAYEDEKQPYFAVYKTTMEFSSSIYNYIINTHEWFYYPVRWAKNDWYDKYSPQGIFQITFNSLGKLFLWIAVILAIFSPVLLIIEFTKK